MAFSVCRYVHCEPPRVHFVPPRALRCAPSHHHHVPHQRFTTSSPSNRAYEVIRSPVVERKAPDLSRSDPPSLGKEEVKSKTTRQHAADLAERLAELQGKLLNINAKMSV